MTALGILLLLCLAGLVLGGSRVVAMIGVFGAICYLPLDQQMIVGGLHITGMRAILLAGVIRVLSRGEHKEIEFTRIDKAVVAFTIVLTSVACIRVGTMAEFVERAGVSYDVLLSFFISRCLLTSYVEMKRLFAAISYLVVPLAIIMVYEARTAKDAFDVLGVSPSHDFRHGLYRAQGSFQHAITAGTFGATLLPLFLGLSYQEWRRFGLIIGVLASAAITAASASSAPMLAFSLGIFSMSFWPLRRSMRAVRWAGVFALLGLEVVMKAHVWFLIARLGGVTGGDAEYRSELIDQAIHHFDQWFLIGFHDTGQWMQNPLADGTADITNQYIRNGVDGGVLSVILFVVILVRCFSNLGSARKALQSHAADDSVAKEWFVWCLGCALFVHSVTIMTVEYFDQMRVVWNVLLAMIVGMSSEVLSNKAQESSSTDTDDGVSTDALQSSDGSPYFASGPEKTPSM